MLALETLVIEQTKRGRSLDISAVNRWLLVMFRQAVFSHNGVHEIPSVLSNNRCTASIAEQTLSFGNGMYGCMWLEI